MLPYLSLTGRILLAMLFLIMASSKMGFIKILGTYEDYIQFMAHFGVPFPKVSFFLALILEFLGGIAILIGFRTRWFCYLLAIYLIPVSLFMHTNFDDPIQFVKFIKNIAIIGSLLFIGSVDKIPFSLDSKTERRTS
jgi:putative oxidoreductase